MMFFFSSQNTIAVNVDCAKGSIERSSKHISHNPIYVSSIDAHKNAMAFVLCLLYSSSEGTSMCSNGNALN